MNSEPTSTKNCACKPYYSYVCASCAQQGKTHQPKVELTRAASPDLRVALVLANELAQAGINFVPIPVLSPEHHKKLQAQLEELLERLS